jgi:hypothetical protein
LQDEDSDEDEDRVGGIFRKAKAIGAQQGTADDMPTENAFRGQGRTLAGGSSSQVSQILQGSCSAAQRYSVSVVGTRQQQQQELAAWQFCNSTCRLQAVQQHAAAAAAYKHK